LKYGVAGACKQHGVLAGPGAVAGQQLLAKQHQFDLGLELEGGVQPRADIEIPAALLEQQGTAPQIGLVGIGHKPVVGLQHLRLVVLT